jgi:hypothetical protein
VSGIGGFDLMDLSRQLFALCDASTWDESRRIVQANPALVDVNNDALLFGLINQAERLGDSTAAAGFKQVSTFLQRCRDLGIDAAVAQMARGEEKHVANAQQLLGRLAEGT